MSTVKEIIHDAGGVSVVALALKLSERTIYKWIAKNALPRSEYTEESAYSLKIAEMCKKFSRKEILLIGNPRKSNPKTNLIPAPI
ncbi:hypothetical protein QE380_003506 [Acinetobacter baylyi]|uniref:Regulatory protein n=1 Tax=Acinetobacter baylyi TaxID=202950 RepID=A0ABU0V236_ACIBI|nr:hypothetical protein [Acinetobacter baylyi]MDQ1210583.1 hypothetical protein [Acinetobacter baylyi]MDR6105823.1 hypothetical protein [Acinetobacter baylyi]MDR6187458.1 hypothetical protein [Acinetobacter baylyi]